MMRPRESERRESSEGVSLVHEDAIGSKIRTRTEEKSIGQRGIGIDRPQSVGRGAVRGSRE